MTRIWEWLKHNAIYLLLTVCAVLGTGILWKVERDKRRSLADQLKIERARSAIAKLTGKREALVAQDAGFAEVAADLDKQIAEARRQVVAVRESVEGKTADEIAARFNELYGRR